MSAEFPSPVPPGTGWPEDPVAPGDPLPPVARSAAGWPGWRPRHAAAARGPGLGLRGLPAAGHLARAGGPREAGGVRRGELLGPPDRRLGRPGADDPGRRPRAGRPRRQPHRPGLHRRPVGRLAVRLAAPGRPGQPADLGPRRRRAAADRAPAWWRRCGARRRRTSRRPRSATPARRGSSARCGCCCPGCGRWSASAASAGTPRCARWPRPGCRSRGRGRSSATRSRCELPATSPCSAATTPRSRTPSPAGSPSR